MTLFLLVLGVNAASLADLTYTTAGGKVTITDCDTGATGELVIPDTIGGNPVTSIGTQAFRSCSGLTNVIISNSVTRIGLGSFQRCAGLTNITISEGVTSIGSSAFQDCKSLTTINFLGTVAPSLGNRVFENISNKATYFVPAESTGYTNPFGGVSFGAATLVDTDGDGYWDSEDAFPDDPTEWADTDGNGVGNNADTDDDGDGVVDANDTFPNDASETVDTDGDGVGNNADTDDDGDGVVDANDALPNDATETVDTDSDGIGNNADLDDDGDGVNDDSDPFPNDANETKDTDGDGVGDNGDIFSNFDDSLITYSDEGDSVTITGCETSASGSLIIPDTIKELPVTSIGISAFFECISLTSISLPDGVTSIGASAFSGCTNLTSITIPDGVTSIGDYAFSRCLGLASITIPDGVTSIGEVAFYQCSALTTIEVSGGNVNYAGANGVLFNAEMTLLSTYPAGKKDSDYKIPEGVTNIGAGAFLYCTDLKSITLPQSVTNIGSYTFQECRSLKNLFMQGPPPSSVGRLAFANLAPNAVVNVKPEWRANYGAAGDTWYGLFVVGQDEEECDNEELTNTITTLVALLAQKDAQIAEKNAQIVELEKRPSLEDIQEARAGSVVLTPTENGTVILRMMIEESSDLSVWENSEESVEVELPLAEGKRFLRFALK